MACIWIISDTHFGHRNMAETFTQSDGTPMRPFATVAEMDDYMVTMWNQKVRPSDHVWHLGDVAMAREPILRIIPQLHGHKRLVRGNHDIFKTKVYLDAGFEEIRGVSVLNGMVFTHIPIHERSLGRFRANVHGHTHCEPDYGVKYLNVCVEQTGFMPITLEEVDVRVRDKANRIGD